MSSFGFVKAYIAYQGASQAANTVDWIVGTLLVSCLYILGLYKDNPVGLLPYLFSFDYAPSLLTAWSAILHLVGLLLCFVWTHYWLECLFIPFPDIRAIYNVTDKVDFLVNEAPTTTFQGIQNLSQFTFHICFGLLVSSMGVILFVLILIGFSGHPVGIKVLGWVQPIYYKAMSNSTDVDPDTRPQMLGPTFTLLPSFPAVASPHSLQDDEIRELNRSMDEVPWSERIQRAGNDPKKQEVAYAKILIALAVELAPKANYLDETPSLSKAEELLKSLDENGCKEWEDGVEAGIQNHNWARLASHPIFRKPTKLSLKFTNEPEWVLPPNSSKQATIKSWSHPYRGDTADLFYQYMVNCAHSALYARLLPLVQSSGMGKSRLIDEFSKKYFVIPFNLREGNFGFPAPDLNVYRWFTLRNIDSRGNDNRFSAFLTALFEEVYNVIKDGEAGIRKRIQDCPELSDADKAALCDFPDSLSGQFRFFMAVGQTFDRQGPLRIKFYDSVLREADELYESVDLSAVPLQEKSPRGKFKKYNSEGVVELQTVVQRLRDIVVNSGSSPIMVLAFDEAHTLFSASDRDDGTPLTSLRRALRGLRKYPVWSVFLSTTGKSRQFAPPPHFDPSGRILWGLFLDAIPFTLLGFDQVAVKFQESMTLTDVISPSFRYSLGRPLWLTRYENGCQSVRDTMVEFAIQKLLCGHQTSSIVGTTELEFAVMSRRLALDFDTTVCNSEEKSNAERNQMTQVERYMRVCLGVKESLESAVTVASSEPILSEAAAVAMQAPRFRSCQALRNILQWPGMSKGDRGELVTCNITIDTLDSVMFENRELKSLSVEVTSYFQALFASDIYRKKIRSMIPSKSANEGREHTFAATFANSHIYVTHFIKVYDYNVLSVEFLAKCAARGVGIVCADNQRAVDIVIPIIIDKNKPLTKDNITALLLQSKNNFDDKTRMFPSLFHIMDPYKLGIFDGSTKDPPPVIRMVYDLASDKSGVSIVKPPVRKVLPREAKEQAAKTQINKCAYTSFDIWCAQASSSTFRAIQTHEDATYAELLKLCRDVPMMFQASERYLESTAMSMYPCGTSSAGHWQFCEAFQEHPDGAADGEMAEDGKGLRRGWRDG